jgi:hypothetical protein
MRVTLAAPISIAFALVRFAPGQQQTSPTWQEYTYAADGFAITAPAPPKPVPSPALPGATAYPVPLKDDNAFVVVRVKAMPNCDALLTRYRDSLIQGKDSDVDPSSLKDLTLNGYSGFESRRKKNTNTILDRWYCTDTHLYALSANWPSSPSLPAAATRVLDSFRILTKVDSKQ